MTDNRKEINAELENLFPGQVKIYSLGSLPVEFTADPEPFPDHIFEELPVDEKFDKLLWQIAGYLKDREPTAVYSFFYRLPKKNTAGTDWVFCSAKLNKCDTGLPKEIVIFSYQLREMDDIKKKLYRVLDNEKFFKENFHSVSLLTKREKDIIGLLVSGLSSSEIAATINISVHTVYTHRKSINHKLNIQNFAGLLKFAEVFDIAALNITA